MNIPTVYLLSLLFAHNLMTSMNNLLYILWNTPPEIFPDSSIPLRWYGLFFALAFLAGQYIITYIFKAEGKPEKDVDALTYYMIGATVIGARLGHCLFYDPDFYLSNPVEILKVWEGGLASHGATVGILTGMWLYARKRQDQSWLWILDRIVIVVALGGSLIRLGNLMNSEILGKPGDLPWSMVFVNPVQRAVMQQEESRLESIQVRSLEKDTIIGEIPFKGLSFHMVFGRDQMQGSAMEAYATSALPHLLEYVNKGEELVRLVPVPGYWKSGFDAQGKPTLDVQVWGVSRHPAMVYESLSTFILFLILFSIWRKKRNQLPEGRLFSLFVIILFSLRFCYEFLKENQVDFESKLPLNMGQILSIPLIIFGLYLFIRSYKSPVVSQNPDSENV